VILEGADKGVWVHFFLLNAELSIKQFLILEINLVLGEDIYEAHLGNFVLAT
jgi:hypothetical protein